MSDSVRCDDGTVTGLGQGGIADAERLAGIANSMDHYTAGLIDGLGLAADARIVDIGAGTGGVAAMIGARYPRAHVVAVDKDTSIIGPEARGCPNVTVVEADVAAWSVAEAAKADGSVTEAAKADGSVPEKFDLVHARFVLSHLPERAAVSAHLRSLLTPTGALMLTEPYQLDEADAAEQAVGRVLAAYRLFAERTGSALTWIRSAPSLLAQLGLTDVEVHVRAGRLGGGAADRWANLIRPVEDRLDVAADDLERFYQVAESTGWQDIPQMIVTVIARAGPRGGRS